MNAKHTPTPWAFLEMPAGCPDRIVRDDEDCSLVCEFPYGLNADSAFIVKAANAHDDLVAALAAALPALMRQAENCTERQSEVKRLGPVCACFSHRTLRAARAALANAGAA